VNTNFAIKLIDEVPPAPQKERVVWCDGGGGPTGHPKVYINLVCCMFFYFCETEIVVLNVCDSGLLSVWENFLCTCLSSR